jgi:hypothetical protein
MEDILIEFRDFLIKNEYKLGNLFPKLNTIHDRIISIKINNDTLKKENIAIDEANAKLVIDKINLKKENEVMKQKFINSLLQCKRDPLYGGTGYDTDMINDLIKLLNKEV